MMTTARVRFKFYRDCRSYCRVWKSIPSPTRFAPDVVEISQQPYYEPNLQVRCTCSHTSVLLRFCWKREIRVKSSTYTRINYFRTHACNLQDARRSVSDRLAMQNYLGNRCAANVDHFVQYIWVFRTPSRTSNPYVYTIIPIYILYLLNIWTN